jgi:spore coat polysaccharide biosynthesis predicted glycosyltransferase SpsG
MNTFLFRVDASAEIGMGHLIRSVALASEVLNCSLDVKIIFLTNELYAYNFLREAGFDVIFNDQKLTEEDFILENLERGRLLFIDKIQNYSKDFIINIKRKLKVVLFHNICDGAFYADIFILPTAHSSEAVLKDKRWKKNGVNFYYGFKYIILNNNIRNIRYLSAFESSSKKVVITTGGSDPRGVLFLLIDWLKQIDLEDVQVVFLAGEAFKDKKRLEQEIALLPKNFSIFPYNSKEFIDATVAIATFGVSSYELLYLGIPFISVAHAENNAIASRRLFERTEAFIDHGLVDTLDIDKFYQDLKRLLSFPDERKTLSNKAKKLIDGKGVIRIAELLLNA